MNKIKYRIIAFIMCTSMLMSCSAVTDNITSVSSDENSENSNIELDIKTMSEKLAEYEENDFYTDWENENPNYIDLNGTSAEINGSGAKINENIITIKTAGTYVVSGKLNNGQIVVDSDSDGAVKLVLNNAEINCLDNAPIYIKNAEKTIISLADKTENFVTDGSSYVLAGESADEPSAAIFSKDNMTINGSGTLTVNANYNDGITGKDNLLITGGNIIINSVDDGLIGRDLLAVKDGNITIDSQGDGIKTTNDTDEEKGNILLENGTYIITSKADGIQAEKNIEILDGKYTINSADDSIHSNNTLDISGGTFIINSGDDGIHADSMINIKGGSINIIESYEGIESAVINISDGDVNVKASDDGINVAGGNDGSSVNGRERSDAFASSGDYILNITGGNVYLDSDGDGLDSNGSIYMSGGTVVVNGPTSNGNGALDYNQTFEISGGLLIAAGSSGMAQAPSETSTQNSLLINYSQKQSAGTLVNITDDSGNSIITFMPKKEYQTLVVSSPDLKLDSTYQLYYGGTADDMGNSGTKLTDFTISKAVLSISDNGEEVTVRGFGQQGGFGGKDRQERPDMNMPEGERPDMSMPQGERAMP